MPPVPTTAKTATCFLERLPPHQCDSRRELFDRIVVRLEENHVLLVSTVVVLAMLFEELVQILQALRVAAELVG
jgi:hypothetical protein